jgi:hypothetical protein
MQNTNSWVDPWVEAQQAWLERQADWHWQLAEQERDNMERFMDAQHDRLSSHAPAPPVPAWGGARYWW